MTVKTKRTRLVPKVFATDSAYIDPLGCNSTVSYKVVSGIGKRLYGVVEIADCVHKIEWYFPDRARSLAKVDKAIEYLQAFRHEFVNAQSVVHAHARTRKKP